MMSTTLCAGLTAFTALVASIVLLLEVTNMPAGKEYFPWGSTALWVLVGVGTITTVYKLCNW